MKKFFCLSYNSIYIFLTVGSGLSRGGCRVISLAMLYLNHSEGAVLHQPASSSPGREHRFFALVTR